MKNQDSSSVGLRVALLAGTLGQGGAEKQLVYIAQALRLAGVDVRVYCLTRGEFYESSLMAIGLQPIWFGRFSSPLLRLPTLGVALMRFRPHIVQSVHFFTSLYAAGAAWLCRAISIGSIRSDLSYELNENGKWGPWQLRLPSVLVANSIAAATAVERLALARRPVRVLQNAIDLSDFDRKLAHRTPQSNHDSTQVLMVGHLIRAKRVDRFLAALARAREMRPKLRGTIVGGGPLLPELASLAGKLELMPDGVEFLGRRDDVPALLSQSAMLVSTSDHEGFANVLLEAMAARLPIVTTPAGDSGRVVQDGHTGYVVDFEDVDGLAQRMVQLADSDDLRRRLGESGRRRVEEEYKVGNLGEKLLAIYRSIAEDLGHRDVVPRVERLRGVRQGHGFLAQGFPELSTPRRRIQ